MRNGLILIGGWVAERFKAPVLKTDAVYAENLGIASNSAMEIAETRREVEFRAGTQSGTHGPVMLKER